jgi:hypothetical protein
MVNWLNEDCSIASRSHERGTQLSRRDLNTSNTSQQTSINNNTVEKRFKKFVGNLLESHKSLAAIHTKIRNCVDEVEDSEITITLRGWLDDVEKEVTTIVTSLHSCLGSLAEKEKSQAPSSTGVVNFEQPEDLLRGSDDFVSIVMPSSTGVVNFEQSEDLLRGSDDFVSIVMLPFHYCLQKKGVVLF